MKAYDLERFVKAQEQDYSVALREIQAGHKESHWIWYIFPQLKGFGQSYYSEYYGIEDADEAAAYLNHPVLGARLRKISEALMELNDDNAVHVMGSRIDAEKLRSCMTLFAEISEDDSVFRKVLDKFFACNMDAKTLARL